MMHVGSLSLAITMAACGTTSDAAALPSGSYPATPHPSSCEPAPATEENMLVRNTRGTLEGTLVLPAGCGPHPVVLIIAGSGPTDREGNQSSVKAQPYRLLAEALAKIGIGSLRYDKAGVGASRSAAPPEAALRFEMVADDAALFIEALRQDDRVSQVGIVGHSEGSLVGMLAAERANVDAFVSLAGAGRPLGEVLREQLTRGLPDEALRERAFEILSALERGERVDDVPKELASLFRPSVQGYLISWLKYDPAETLRELQVPSVFIVQGTTDTQVSVADAERLARGRPAARLLLIEGMNHVLKAADSSSASQRAAYTNPDLPIVPELAREIGDFLRRDPEEKKP